MIRALRYGCFSIFCITALALRGEVIDSEAVFAKANDNYVAGKFTQAKSSYEQLLPDNQSVAVYYNLGNTYYKLGNFPKAILNYERALVLNPRDPEIQANLKLARDAAQLPTGNLNGLQQLARWLPLNTWVWLGSVAFWSVILLILLARLWEWRWPLRGGLLTLCVIVLLLSGLALGGYHTLSKTGIVIGGDAALTVSPTETSPKKELLKPGQDAHIERKHGDYYYARTADGKSGWIKNTELVAVWP